MKLLFELDKKDYDPKGTVGRRPSVRGIVFKNDKIAMVYSKQYGYYKFPGGGIDEGESQIDTLIREMREETGLLVIPESIQEFGYVHRVQKGSREDIFVQDNYYYFCRVEDGQTEQELDAYEAEEEFTLAYVSLEEAIQKNEEALKTTLVGDEFYTVMIEREVKVLRLMTSQLDVRTFCESLTGCRIL